MGCTKLPNLRQEVPVLAVEPDPVLEVGAGQEDLTPIGKGEKGSGKAARRAAETPSGRPQTESTPGPNPDTRGPVGRTAARPRKAGHRQLRPASTTGPRAEIIQLIS